MKIESNCFGIIVDLIDPDPDHENRWLGGTISSDLHEKPSSGESEEEAGNRDKFNAAMDAIESFVLAAACTGIDITTPDFEYAIETAVQACAKHFE